MLAVTWDIAHGQGALRDDPNIIRMKPIYFRALQQHYNRLPAARRAELENTVMRYYGVDSMDPALLQRALTINAK